MHLSGAVALQGPFSGLFVAPPIPRVAPRCVVAVAVRLCAPVVPNADRTPGLRKRLFISDPSLGNGGSDKKEQAKPNPGEIHEELRAFAARASQWRQLRRSQRPREQHHAATNAWP